MPDLYYSRLFDIGNGKQMGALFVDTCLALCANYSYSGNTGGKLLASEEVSHEHFEYSDEFANYRFGIVNCSNSFMIDKG